MESLASAQKTALIPLFKNLPTPWSIPVTGVCAVYLLTPTEKNVDGVIEDVMNNLYPEGVFVNWTSKLPRPLLERLGQGLVSGGNQSNIRGMWDRHCNFKTLNPSVFTLSLPSSYLKSTSGDIKEIEDFVLSTAYGLTSVAGVIKEELGDVIVRCEPGGCAEMVGKKLCEVIRGNKGGGTGGVRERPVVLLIDRCKHVRNMVQHQSTYQALMEDVLEYEGGKVKDGEGGSWEVGEEEEWWGRYKFRSFPEAVEGNGKELKEVEVEEAKLRSINPSTTTGLLGAVSDLPALLARKKSLETHTSILTACMAKIGERDIPVFYDVESRLGRGMGEKIESEVEELVREKGTEGDKVRLSLIYGLSSNVSTTSLKKVWDLLPAGKYDKLHQSLLQIRSISSMDPSAGMSSQTPPTSGNNALLNAVTGVGGAIVGNVREKIAGLVGKGDICSTARVVSNIMNGREGTEDDNWLYLDPRVHPPTINIPRSQRPKPTTAIVFGIGGGGFGEYGNIMVNRGDWNVVYGATEILGGEEFFQQMAK